MPTGPKSKRFGYTAQETLDLTQSLYEEYKLLSYPRTESRHLSHDMLPELPKVIRALPKQWPTGAALAALDNGLKSDVHPFLQFEQWS